MCFKHALFLKCETNRFWNCKNNVKQMNFFKAILKLCSFSFCIWFYVFAPGSHCFAADIKQICDLHSPLPIDLNCSSPIFNLQKLGRQQSNCSKTGPQKIQVPPSQLDVQMCFFHIFFTFFSFTFFFHVFFQVHFQNAFFSHFFQAHFQNTFFFLKKNIFYIFVKHVKTCKTTAFWKCVWKNMWTNASWTCEKHVNRMWKNVNKWEQKGSWKVPVS